MGDTTLALQFQLGPRPERAALPADTVQLWLCPRPARQRSEPQLRQLLAAYLDQPAASLALRRNPHGRPELADQDCPLRFSASHAGDWLLVAIADQIAPGVDIERLRPRPQLLAVARRYFPAADAQALADLPDSRRELAFFRAWTAREAVVKATGRGIAFGLDRLHLDDTAGTLRMTCLHGDDARCWQLHTLPAPDGYVSALAWRGPPKTIQATRLAEPLA